MYLNNRKKSLACNYYNTAFTIVKCLYIFPQKPTCTYENPINGKPNQKKKRSKRMHESQVYHISALFSNSLYVRDSVEWTTEKLSGGKKMRWIEKKKEKKTCKWFRSIKSFISICTYVYFCLFTSVQICACSTHKCKQPWSCHFIFFLHSTFMTISDDDKNRIRHFLKRWLQWALSNLIPHGIFFPESIRFVKYGADECKYIDKARCGCNQFFYDTFMMRSGMMNWKWWKWFVALLTLLFCLRCGTILIKWKLIPNRNKIEQSSIPLVGDYLKIAK